MIWLDFLLPAACMLEGVRSSAIPSTSEEVKRGIVSDSLDYLGEIFASTDTKAYAPVSVDCPSTKSFLRSDNGLSPDEQAWLKGRKDQTQAALKDFLTRANMKGFDPKAYLSKNSPIIGIAFSGGGYRAMLNGAGVMSAWDSRTSGSTDKGGVGGLLQSATYMAGLSGGSWLVGTVSTNNFTSIQDIIKNGKIWNLEDSIYHPSGGIVATTNYFGDLVAQVDEKHDAGYPISLTDYWGAALSRQFIDLANGGPGLAFSDIANFDPFKKHEMPFPIVVADSRSPDTTTVPLTNTMYEINVFEFGSHDPALSTFFPTKFIGSVVDKGTPANKSACVVGFDNAGYVMGTSATLFNQLLLNINSTGLGGILYRAVTDVLNHISKKEADIARYVSNPFYGVNPGTYEFSNDRDLILVDGGEDLQNIPLNPLLQKKRNVDVIFAVDSSADVVYPDGKTTVNWPNGTAMVATYQRSLLKQFNGTSFPAVPDQNTFVNSGLNKQPTFFGCHASNYSDPSNPGPLVVYIPNAPYTYMSNFSTYTMTYTDEQRNGVITNGYNVATLANGTVDKDWAACMGCAIIQRSYERSETKMTDQCTQCFSRYCWDGKMNSSTPATYTPSLFIQSKKTSAAVASRGASVGVIASLAVGWGLAFVAL